MRTYIPPTDNFAGRLFFQQNLRASSLGRLEHPNKRGITGMGPLVEKGVPQAFGGGTSRI